MPVQVIEVDANHCFASCGPILLMVWRRETTRPGVMKARRAILALAERHPGGLGLVMIVESTAEVPSGEVRSALSQALGDFGPLVRRSALIHEGTGFRAAAVRAIVTGISLVARQPYPHQVFDRVELAVTWVVQGLPRDAPSAEDLRDAIGALRNHQVTT